LNLSYECTAAGTLRRYFQGSPCRLFCRDTFKYHDLEMVRDLYKRKASRGKVRQKMVEEKQILE